MLWTRFGPEAVGLFEQLLESGGISIVPFDHDMAETAFEAFRRFGKGQGHPAQLNIVDCAIYALARFRSQALLLKGHDFDRRPRWSWSMSENMNACDNSIARGHPLWPSCC